jgi:hypothetical protein
VSESHDWLLVAPWYHWPRQAVLGRKPRQTRPVLQKYEDSKFVDEFLADPQHSLKWNDDDWVYELSVLAAKRVTSGPLAGKVAEQAVERPPKSGRFEKYLARKTSIRKLFLDSHRRFYLVVCELHCDVPGFPRATTDDVCQAGFVVRRHYTSYPAAAEPEAATILKELSKLQLKLAKLERVPAAKRATKRWEQLVPAKQNGGPQTDKLELELAIVRQRKELRRWAADHGVEPARLGWVASERRHVGSWQVVEGESQTLLEDVYPLYPLIPGPNDPEHSGQGSTIYFGVVPTAGSDHDPDGYPRYDDRHLYEINCFVRRHKPTCPRTLEPNDCNGELFWSDPTESFRLAAHFDPVGTSHRPINIQLPDFPSLAAAVSSRPVGALSPVRMTQPPRSSLSFGSGVPPTSGSVGSGQICFLAIPLITIVAWFVLNIFLPIIVFLFGLWFLLRLKICIPPSLEVQAAVDLQLSADLGKIDVDLGLAASANLDLDVGAGNGFDPLTLNADLTQGLTQALGGGVATTNELSSFSNKPLAALNRELTKPQKGPDFSAGIVWEAPVARAEAEVLVA